MEPSKTTLRTVSCKEKKLYCCHTCSYMCLAIFKNSLNSFDTDRESERTKTALIEMIKKTKEFSCVQMYFYGVH